MRKILKYKMTIVLLLAILNRVTAFSRQPGDSLIYYLEIAAKNNPGVLKKFTEYKAALQKIPQVGSLPDPELNLGVFLKPMELMDGRQVADIRLMQMFPLFGVLKNAKDEMSLMAKAKLESFRDEKLSLYFNIQRTWYELIKYQLEINISESNIEILKTIERLALVRFKSPLANGAGSSSGGIFPAGASSMSANSMGSQVAGSGLADLYRVQIEVADVENNIASLRNQMVTVSARFNTYLNRPVTSAVSLPDTLMPEIFGFSVASVSDSMLANNPMLGMLKFEQQSLDARYRMVTAMGYPMVGFGINYSLISKSEMSTSSMNGKDMVMPMITVTLPIYRKKYNAMKSETELLKTATLLGYEATSNSLQSEYYEALQLYQDAIRRQKLYADQSQLADNSLSIMLKSFSSSSATLTDILRVRQQTLDYKFKHVEAMVDYNTAVAWLKRLMAFYQIQ